MKKNSSSTIEADAAFAANLYRDRAAINQKAQEVLSAGSRQIAIRLNNHEIALAKRQAETKGLKYQTYIKMLLHEALGRDRYRFDHLSLLTGCTPENRPWQEAVGQLSGLPTTCRSRRGVHKGGGSPSCGGKPSRPEGAQGSAAAAGSRKDRGVNANSLRQQGIGYSRSRWRTVSCKLRRARWRNTPAGCAVQVFEPATSGSRPWLSKLLPAPSSCAPFLRMRPSHADNSSVPAACSRYRTLLQLC
jgi:predicted DNA binding CopG/RHH family protein